MEASSIFKGMVAVVTIVVPFALSLALALGIVLPAFRASAWYLLSRIPTQDPLTLFSLRVSSSGDARGDIYRTLKPNPSLPSNGAMHMQPAVSRHVKTTLLT